MMTGWVGVFALVGAGLAFIFGTMAGELQSPTDLPNTEVKAGLYILAAVLAVAGVLLIALAGKDEGGSS